MTSLKIKVHRKGGPGSGNWGHSGRPGLIGGSSPGSRMDDIGIRQTSTIKLRTPVSSKKVELIVDTDIVNAVRAFNSAGLYTTHSCSGHVCSRPLESQISFRAVGQDGISAVSKLRGTLDKATLDWELVEKVDNFYELYTKRGFYGTQDLRSSDEIVSKAYADLNMFASALK